MGAVSSCLSECFGGSEPSKSDEHTPLNPNAQTYSDFAYPPSPSASHTSPQAILHEREFFDRLVTQTSENLIDIFAPPMLGGSGGRGEWYKVVVERMSVPDNGLDGDVEVVGSAVGDADRKWLNDIAKKAEEAVGKVTEVKGVGKLVVGLD